MQSFGCVEFCSRKVRRVAELDPHVKIVCKLVNYNFKNVYFEKNKPDGIIKKTPSTKLFKSIMSYGFIRLEDGIKNTITWYLNSKDINTKSKAKEFLV